ncbi:MULTISPECIES: STAS domain-containing protein [unclassified Streptomyces]|uniref:STAS domain-containing protein n=1 Tax=unclassified Streptomyces TaxID=2593676 RepID=UPI003439A596
MTSRESSVVTETPVSGVVVVRVLGEQDGEGDGLPVLRDILMHSARNAEVERTVLDLSGTEFVDSAFLHLLINVRPAYEQARTKLVIAGPLPVQVRRLFEVTGTMDAFTHADSADDAVRGV